MIKLIMEKLKKARMEGFNIKAINWRMVSRKLRQVIAFAPRLIALPFFCVGLILVVIAIVPAQIANILQDAADNIED